MRLSSIVSLVVVSASLALGGCAADAEETAPQNPNVALSDKDQVIAPEQQDRTSDARQIGQIKDLYENPADSTKARDVEKFSTGVANPRIDVQPSVFGQVPSEKIGQLPSAFRPLNVLEQNVEVEQGFLPYSGKKP